MLHMEGGTSRGASPEPAQRHGGWSMELQQQLEPTQAARVLGLRGQQPPRTPAQHSMSTGTPPPGTAGQGDARVRMHQQQAKHAEPIPQEPLQQGGWVHRGGAPHLGLPVGPEAAQS